MVIYMKKNAFIFVSISFLCVTFFTLLPLLNILALQSHQSVE